MNFVNNSNHDGETRCVHLEERKRASPREGKRRKLCFRPCHLRKSNQRLHSDDSGALCVTSETPTKACIPMISGALCVLTSDAKGRK